MAKVKAKKIEKEIESCMEEGMKGKICGMGSKTNCGGSYFLGMIGAAVYFISTATSFGSGVWGIIKALVWPATLIFEVLKYIAA